MRLTKAEQIAERRVESEQRIFERESISRHYDQNPEAFSMVLGPTMGYAAGVFLNPGEDLEIGQNRKVDWIVRALGVGPGFRLLDAGCGWGNVLLPLAQSFEGHFHGITLSEIQRDFLMAQAAAMGISDRVHISVGHIGELPLPESYYDGIVFSGSLIHMHHRRKVHLLVGRVLRPGGKLFISDSYVPIQWNDARDSRAANFVRAVFGSVRLLSLPEELALIEEAGLDVREVHELTDSYIITLDRWISNIRKHREQIDRIVPGLAKDLQSFMNIGKITFQRRTALEYIIVASKRGGPNTK